MPNPRTKSVALLGRMPNSAYKKRYQPKTKKHGGFKKSKLGKYNNRGYRLDGHFFHSEAEANRYMQLKVLVTAGKIDRLERQVSYPIHIDGFLICTYVADFRYYVRGADGSIEAIVVEDVKGLETAEYKIKKKLTEAKHKIKIMELPASWMKHYEDRHGLECEPVIKELQAAKKARASDKKEKNRLFAAAAREAKAKIHAETKALLATQSGEDPES